MNGIRLISTFVIALSVFTSAQAENHVVEFKDAKAFPGYAWYKLPNERPNCYKKGKAGKGLEEDQIHCSPNGFEWQKFDGGAWCYSFDAPAKTLSIDNSYCNPFLPINWIHRIAISYLTVKGFIPVEVARLAAIRICENAKIEFSRRKDLALLKDADRILKRLHQIRIFSSADHPNFLGWTQMDNFEVLISPWVEELGTAVTAQTLIHESVHSLNEPDECLAQKAEEEIMLAGYGSLAWTLSYHCPTNKNK